MTAKLDRQARIVTSIHQFPMLANLSADQHNTIISGWINSVSVYHVAKELNLQISLVEAYYGVRNIMMYESEGNWPHV